MDSAHFFITYGGRSCFSGALLNTSALLIILRHAKSTETNKNPDAELFISSIN